MAFGSPKPKRSPEILIVPLIDILLVVLIFLLVTTSFRKFPVVEINLPRAGESTSTEKPEVVVVSITTTPPAIYINQALTDIEDIKFVFEDIARKNPETRIALNADKDAPYGIVMRIWQSVQQAGLTKIQALTQEAIIDSKPSQ